MEYLFYDIEVFKHDSLVVFKNIENEVVYKCWNEDKFVEAHDERPRPFLSKGFMNIENIIKDKILVGYNNHNYDDIILTDMMKGRSQTQIKQDNDYIIENNKGYINPCDLDCAKKMRTFDCFQQIDLSRPSLKLIEGNMGKSVLESSVPFDIDRPLTDEEKLETERYCEYDVETTINVFKRRIKDYFDIRQQLDRMVGLDFTKWNTTTLAATVLTDKPLTKWKRIQGFEQEWLDELSDIHPDVAEMWKEWKPDSRGKSIKVRDCDCDITFGFGGLHGVHSKRKRFENVKLLDVGSMYPSIIYNINGLGESTEKYDEIRKERLAIKHTDPVKAGALKLVLNSVYGLLKNQYSVLFNPYVSTSICVYGQLALYDLCVQLNECGYTVMNINTDGVAFVDENNRGDNWKYIQKEWEQKFKLSLELDEFDLWYQKDVNNYIAMKGDKIKVKGGDVNKYHGEGKLFSNNNARIIQIALVDKLLKGIEPMQTLMNHLDEPSLYQYVLRVGSTFQGVIDSDGKTDYNKVNRVFPVKNSIHHTRLYKHRADGAKVLFPDSPERMMVWNDDVSKLRNFKQIVDLPHYLNIINKKLEQWGE